MITKNYILLSTVLIIATFSSLAQAQINPDTCFVFRNGSYSGSQISKNQFFSTVSNEGSLSCSYGSIVGSNEGRFYAKNAETGQVNRLGGEYVSEYDAQVLASQNNIQFFSCVKLVCAQNPVNTQPGMVEPEEQIAPRADAAAQQVVAKVFESHIKEYLKLISYAQQLKNSLSGFSSDYIYQLAIATPSYKAGYGDGLKACSQSCVADGESQGKSSAAYQARYQVDNILDTAFQQSKKPIFEPMVIPPQQKNLEALTPGSTYSENVAQYWDAGNGVYHQKINSVSSCGSYSCGNYNGFSISANNALSSLPYLLSSNQNLMDYNGEIYLEKVFELFDYQSVYVDPSLSSYYKMITSSNQYQSTSDNKATFKKHFLAAAESAIRSQWPNEVNKYVNYHPVANHASEILQSVLSSLGHSIGYNHGYAEKFLAPAQSGYSKVFNQAFKDSYNQRIDYYNKNAVFTDVKVAVSNPKLSVNYAAYDEVLLTLKGLSNKGFVEGTITCELKSDDPKITAVGKKAFKIPAFTKTDKEVALGVLGQVRGEKISTNEKLYFNVQCGEDSFRSEISVAWTESIKRLAQETRPAITTALVSYIRFQLNAAYIAKFKSYKQQDTGLDTLSQQLVAVYKTLSATEKGRLDAVKDSIIKGAFGEEPKKKLFNANVGYKMHQSLKATFSPIGWMPAPKK
jgi:hypothetical protein